MEEKKEIKISLSTFFLILSIIFIIIMAYFLYKLYNDRQLANNEITELKEQVGGLENTISNLQNTITNSNNTTMSVTNTSAETTSNTTTQTTSSAKKTFSNEEIKTAIQDYLHLVAAYAGSPATFVEELGFTNINTSGETTPDNFINSKIKYSEFKNKVLNYMSEACYEKEFGSLFKNIDGYLYIFCGGATGLEYEVKSVTKKEDNSDSSYIAIVDDIHLDDTREQFNEEFNIENYNGKCVISYARRN